MERRPLRCESILLKSYWIMVVMDVFTRRIIGFAVAPADLDGPDVCRMFNHAIAKQITSKHMFPKITIPCFAFIGGWRTFSRLRTVERRATIEAWRQDYNHLQPHSSIRALTPSEFAALKLVRITPPQGGETSGGPTCERWEIRV